MNELHRSRVDALSVKERRELMNEWYAYCEEDGVMNLMEFTESWCAFRYAK